MREWVTESYWGLDRGWEGEKKKGTTWQVRIKLPKSNICFKWTYKIEFVPEWWRHDSGVWENKQKFPELIDSS